MIPRTVLAAFAVSFLLTACTPPSTECSPDNCGGCCDASGVCQPGDVMDMCGGAGLACDVCVAPQVCGGGKCGDGSSGGGAGGGGGVGGGSGGGGGMCTPTTCAAQNKNCGSISDGCGGMLTCGTCSSPLSCGGSGQANVCGVMCTMTCPAGYACNAVGACAGGTPNNLALDVKTVRVTGNITINGAPPVNVGTSCTTYPTDDRATVTFIDAEKGYRVSSEIPCSSANTAFSVDLFPGTYSVRVAGSSGGNTNLPGASFEATTGFVVAAAPINGKVFDVKTVDVSGTITLNGALPMNVGTYCTSTSSYTKARVVFSDKAKGYYLTANVPCSSAPFAYSLAVFPGTYEVRVEGTSEANLPINNYPSQGFLAEPALVVSAPIAGKVLDVKSAAISGQLTLNGAAVMNVGNNCNYYPTNVKARVLFIEKAKGYQMTATVLCSSATFAFSTTIHPGSYEVRVVGTKDANLPQASFQVASNLVVSGPMANQTFDVKSHAVTGNITINGSTPTDVGSRCSNYPDDEKATVTFIDKERDYAIDAEVRCSSATYQFDGVLAPGNYEVRVKGSLYSNLPIANFLAGSLAVTGPIPGQVFDVKTVPFSGTLNLNGMVATDVGSDCLTFPNDVKATVTFTDASKGHVLTANVLCSSATFAFGTALFPGTYEVRVAGSNRTDLPVASAQVHSALVVTTGKSAQVLDVKTLSAGGKVTVNGMAPMNIGNDCFMYPNNVKANVTFRDASKGYLLTAKVLCGSADFAFSSAIFPGTYEVRVTGTALSNVPAGSYLAVMQLAVP